jgi:primosomal protein N' (replication factor Y)
MVTAEVFVNMPARRLAKSFTYQVPVELAGIGPGWRVLVPFGRRKAEGFVVSTSDTEGPLEGLRPILAAIDDEPWFTDHMLAVAKWVSEYYLSTPAEAMRLFIPGKAGIKSATVYSQTDPAPAEAAGLLAALTESQRQVYDRLNGGKTLTKLTRELGGGAAAILRQLVRRGLVAAEDVTRRTARTQYQTIWRLAVAPETAATMTEDMKRRPAQARALAALIDKSPLTPADLRELKIALQAMKGLAAAGLVTAEAVPVARDSYAGFGEKARTVVLTPEQQAALDEVLPAITGCHYASFLLHGVTGSGKTQVYIEAAAAARRQGRQVVVLVPEIALTGQIVQRFKARFGADVLVLHSRLTVGERYDTWLRLRGGEAGIVIGARSAVFAPLADPGLFIIDEEQEFTYKQEESPRYHTRAVALKRAELAGAAVVLGSATPAVETYHAALAGEHKLLEMPKRIDGALLPTVTLVDMREELKAGRRSVIAAPLRELLTATVAKGEQAIILLNRRGYATFVLCRECGEVMRCSHCAVSLVYHATGNLLRCHYCQATQPTPDVCPTCGSRYIRYFGTGTQKVEEELAATLPDARVVRMDQDTTGGKLSHDQILSAFAAGKYDILLGTQMVAKGHDIKNVTAVGIISADTALNLPDFRAAERTFMLLTQAAGRAGRGDRPGQVVVQTYNPEHYAVLAGAGHDYAAFYAAEIVTRRELDYPPYARLIKLTVQGKDEYRARRQAEDVAATLRRAAGGPVAIIGPFPAPVSRISDVFRLHILLKGADLADVKPVLAKLVLAGRDDVTVDVDPVSVL